jgi:hypothetical protein
VAREVTAVRAPGCLGASSDLAAAALVVADSSMWSSAATLPAIATALRFEARRGRRAVPDERSAQ